MRFFIPLKFIAVFIWGTSLGAQQIARVPFELTDNLLFIKVSINGSRPMNFMFDSGAGITVLNHSAADGLDLNYSGRSQIGTSGQKVESKSSPKNTLQIGTASLEQVPLEVIGLDHLSDYFKVPVDGIIGYDLFANYVILIDADRQSMTFYGSMDGVDTRGWAALPSYRIDNNKIAIETSLRTDEGEYVNYPMTLDTANPDALYLFPKAISEGRIAVKKRRKRVYGFSADTTVTENHRGTIRAVRLAGKEWRNVPTVIPTDPITLASFSGAQSYGLLGQELLLEFNMIYDYRNNRIYLKERKKN
jgi:hypothetical protein